MAKLKAGRLSREVPDGCLQFWGGMGYTWETRVSRLSATARLGSIGGGADEVMLGIICKYMGILPRPEAPHDAACTVRHAPDRQSRRDRAAASSAPRGALGLRTVAVYSDADRDAPHVQLADTRAAHRRRRRRATAT